ncbi:acyltransferase [Wenyingzhuangia sp. chi5]|uniref:Acyltransferase n=1 Tax=Wenyingzhuangia gilva TaxID=3057677 RepID=A0ABT8VPM6_9FLAO|nr:acyltransferase [Wenyingzhuangia sp. chi5]MDO3693902.1 acyltransferase [Wenyingzhuangia sp. chi5]
MRNISPQILNTKPHFEILDGLRGLAAIVVVVFHFMEIAITDYSNNFIAHGYLAVDFFFCLSGFVVSYAYDNRMAEMSLMTFLKKRLIRLQPLVIVGSVLGLLTFMVDPFSNLPSVYGFKDTVLIFITSIFMIPYPVMPERYFNLFSLNAPSWSLFWEYIANLLYAVVFIKVTKKVLILLVLLASIGLCYTGWVSGNLAGGWGGSNFFDGFARISFSFLMGMLVYRSHWIIKNNLGLISMSVLLMIAFLIPYNDAWNWFIEPIVIIFYFPLLVALGAGATLDGRYEKINKFSGNISYPLYMTHYPFVWVFLTYVIVEKPSYEQLWLVIPVSVILLIGLSYLVFRFVDFPARRFLTDKINLY